MAILLLGSVLAGCTVHPLREVPINGATPEQAAAAGKAVTDFETWVGEGRVDIHRIQFGPMPKNSGRYWGAAGDIRIDSDVPADKVAMVVTHELCHALDRQEGLLDEPVAAFDDEIAAILADDAHPLRPLIAGLSARQARSELFADVCEQGPLRDAMLADPCPDDDAQYADVAAWVNDHAWTGAPDAALDDGFSLGPTVTWAGTSDISLLLAFGSQSADRVVLGVVDADSPSGRTVYASAVDGSEADPFYDATFALDAAGYAVPPPVGAPDTTFQQTTTVPVLATVRGDVVLRLVSGARNDIDGSTLSTRLIATSLDSGAWTVIPGLCPGPMANVFATAHGAYVAWPEGSDVHWAPVDRAE